MNDLNPKYNEENEALCPVCGLSLDIGGGKLPQSGHGTHLPTMLYTCECGYKHWAPAIGETWETTEIKDAKTGQVLSVPRR